uniref:Uncharacterized protein n=1 Tax=Salmonella enteritidis TaxID=149539 RepID=A0A1S6KRW6_SALEN|nr:hypothetical protein [Salmonella enterica subsp. enterica serovar Enteritidis]
MNNSKHTVIEVDTNLVEIEKDLIPRGGNRRFVLRTRTCQVDDCVNQTSL